MPSSSLTPTLPYGSWPSSISSDLLTQQSIRLGEPQITDAACYWLESRPWEKGRSVLMRKSHHGEATEVLPDNYSVRSCAHEYGGGSYLVAGKKVYFVEASDQRIYQMQEGLLPEAITPAGHYRYADFCLDPQRQRLICIREDHTDEGQEERNEIIAINLHREHDITTLVTGHDFFSNPKLSPDGSKLSWLCWDHPHMPWDQSECWLAEIESCGTTTNPKLIAGGPGESIFQPQWSPDGKLYLVSDRSNWWNLYRYDPSTHQLQSVAPLDAEFATPQWVFGMSCYSFLSATELLACCSQNGLWQLVHIHLPSDTLTALSTPYCDISQVQCHNGQATLLAASATSNLSLFHLSSCNPALFNINQLTLITASSKHALPDELISRATPITFPSGEQAQAHGFYYPPHNKNFKAPDNTQPPLIVLCHGGPTGATETGLNLKIQYWTSRGFAVMDVNYRGSTGYGRNYREQLNGQWGVFDVEDVCAAANYLVQQGLVNGAQLAIKGSSAGGYTVLAALTFSSTFTAGVSLYGIGNLETLATDTHKFEARYLDSLVGPYPATQALYQQRSPLFHADHLSCPVIFFQGLDDKVVPPNQAQSMVSSLDSQGVQVAHVEFVGEGHGFRQAEAIKRSLEAEWSFYSQIFGFDIPSSIVPVEIKNR